MMIADTRNARKQVHAHLYTILHAGVYAADDSSTSHSSNPGTVLVLQSPMLALLQVTLIVLAGCTQECDVHDCRSTRPACLNSSPDFFVVTTL